MELKKLKISFKDSSFTQFHIHNEIDLAIKSAHHIWLEIDVRPSPSSDLQVVNQVLFTRCYAESVAKFQSLFPAVHTPFIFDLGAYTGISAIYLKSVFPLATVCCLEPNAENYALLSNNIRHNNLTQVYHVHAAVWNKNTRVSLDETFRDGKSWSLVYQENPAGTVPAHDLPTLMQSRQVAQIDFLKMDVEGAEQMLLGDPECARTFLPKTRFIAFELHEEFLTQAEAKAVFDQFGFDVAFGGDVSYAWNKSLLPQ